MISNIRKTVFFAKETGKTLNVTFKRDYDTAMT